MIRFDRVPEPFGFDDRVRKPGKEWLWSHPDTKRPRDYWNLFKPALAEGFRQLCGYSAMFEPVGSVDHYISVATDRALAYEWGNLRFASEWINKSKQNEDTNVLDPFEVGDDWFELLLPSLQLVVSGLFPAEFREKAEYTLMRLHLRDDERVIRQRQTWYELYCRNELSLDGLRRMAPLIARAVEKQTRENMS